MAEEDRYIGQTYGPAGMGMKSYMDRPEAQPRPNISVEFGRPDINVRELGQNYGPAGMGMNAYVNRPETQVGPRFGPPANIGYDRAGADRGWQSRPQGPHVEFGPPANIGFDRAGAGIFGGGGSSAYAANDIVDAIMGGMNRSQQDEGFEVAGGPGMVEKRMLQKFWGTAVNKFPPGTATEILTQERDRLFNIWKNKAYTPKPGGGLLKFLKGIGPKGGGPLGIGMDLGLDFLESEQGQELYKDLYGDAEVQVI